MKIYLSIVLISLGLSIDTECGTQLFPNSELEADLVSKNSTTLGDGPNTREVRWVPITYHIVRQDDGEGGIPVDRVESSLVHLNSAYSDISFNFYRISDIDYIDNTDYYVNIDVLDLVSLLNFILNY